MNTIRNFIKKQAVVTYFILTFVITWGAMLLMAGPQGFPLSEEQLSALGPMIYVGMLVGPSFSALLLTALSPVKPDLENYGRSSPNGASPSAGMHWLYWRHRCWLP